MRLVQKYQHRLRLASVIFDVFLELMTKTHPKDSKFQYFVSIVWIFFLIHYENGIKIIFIGHMHVVCVCVCTACCSMTATKNVIMRKENIIEYVEWMENGKSISIESVFFSLSLNVSVVLWCWNSLEAR